MLGLCLQNFVLSSFLIWFSRGQNDADSFIKKIPKSDWIRGRLPNEKMNLISWLIDGCYTQALSGPDSCSDPKYSKLINLSDRSHPGEFQSFDGFYNNIFKIDLGAVDTPLLRKVPPVYEDSVYKPVKGTRKNPFSISDALMKRYAVCGEKNDNACGSRTGKSALLVYFGQQVAEEILDVQRPGCPPEYFNIHIPKGHRFRKSEQNLQGKTQMPFLRSRYDQKTGHSPSNPRQQLNEITPWIDGGLVYGTSKAWSDVLRTEANGKFANRGKLASNDPDGLFPVKNRIRLPLVNPPPPAYHQQFIRQHQTAKVDRFFVLGNPRGNENAFLFSFGVVLFRWHNHIATYLGKTRPSWSNERVFQETRKWVIATHQQIVLYDWLPEWLGEGIDSYQGYDPTIDPQIEQFFQTAAMRFGHTLVTPGAYMRDYAEAECQHISFYGTPTQKMYKQPPYFSSNHTVRTCNIFWRPKEPFLMHYDHIRRDPKDARHITDIDPLLMGMASQLSEREDNMIVEDLRGNVFGPLEFSRRDLMAINIQRGRDHGTTDYNTAREAFGLEPVTSVEEFLLSTGSATPRKTVRKMENVHIINKKNCNDAKSKSCLEERMKAWYNIDVWTGGILETSDRPGPLFRAIIKDQFSRIRKADRFWFENKKWKTPRFNEDQIKRIKTLTIYDMIVSVTRMLKEDLQSNPFRVPIEQISDDADFLEKCVKASKALWVSSRCWKQIYDKQGRPWGENISSTCYHFPQLHSKTVSVEPCKPENYVGHYDYFQGSEASFILTFIAVGVLIFAIACCVPLMVSIKQRQKAKDTLKIQKELKRSFKMSGKSGTPYAAQEWISSKDGTRSVAVFVSDKMVVEIYSHKNELLRSVDVGSKKSIDVILVTDGIHLIIKNPTEYDCVLRFDGQLIRTGFLNSLHEKLVGVTEINELQATLKQSLSSAVTKHERLGRLENFFRIVFAQAFNIDKPSGTKRLLDPKTIREVINTELTRAEFADALGMNTNSQFVEKMFGLVDRDSNGFISFREFLDMIVIFAKGSAEDKAQLMFEMYDIERTGKLSALEFKNMIKSMIEAASADVSNEDVNELFNTMMNTAGLDKQSHVTVEDFQRILGQYKDALGYAQLNFRGLNVPEAKSGSRQSFQESARAAVVSVYGGQEMEEAHKDTGSAFSEEKDASVLTNVHKINRFTTWFELYRLQIFWTLLFTLLVIAIFAERAYYFSVEREHAGLRHIAGYGVTVTRGAASSIMFCYATLLLAMCRNLITYLRETFLHRYIPFDNFVKFHTYVAYTGLIFSVIHIIGHSINFYHISTQTASDLSCLFNEYFRPTHVLPKFHYWAFQTITGITGFLLVIQLALIYMFATSYARTYAFQMFWTTHNTYPIFYVLMILHGSGRIVQEPIFHYFLIGPLILFVFDRMLTTSRRKIEIPVLRADLLPSGVTRLEFARPTGFDYKSGQWVKIACLALNTDEYHPFTLSSAPHESSLTVHIRAVGPFTTNIRRTYERSLPKLYLDGPYGEGHQDWWRYEVSVLIGGGIGLTPFASILKDVAANSNPRNCKKIYFLWVTKTQKQFEWMVDILRDVEKHKIIAVHIFVTEIYGKFDMRTVLLYICERHFQKVNNKSLFTGLKAISHFGRPNFQSFFRSLRMIHPNVLKFGVFSCGPLPMTKSVDDACSNCNNDIDNHGAIFQHHFENF